MLETHNKLFSMVDVRQMREMYESGQETIADIARGHLVSTSTIRRIVKHQTYREPTNLRYSKGIINGIN